MFKGMRGRLVLRVGFLLVVLFILTVGIVAFFFRESVINSSKENAMTVAEIVRDTLTSYMVLGVIDKRDLFLERLLRDSLVRVGMRKNQQIPLRWRFWKRER